MARKNDSFTPRVLLLDGHTVQAYSVSLALKKKGSIVTVFCESKISYGYASKYPDTKVISPKIKDSASIYLDFLLSYLKDHTQDVIIPLFNDSAELVSEFKKDIELLGVKVAVPEWQIFINAHNKELLMNICKENDIPHPRTATLNESTIESSSKYVGFPSLIKPNISAGASGIKYVNSLEECRTKFEQSRNGKDTYTLQEYVNHSDFYFNLMIYRYKTGEFSPSITIKILRYFPIKGGSSSYSTVVRNEELEKVCQKTLDCLNWHGFADFDIIQDNITNEFKIIEINPRVPSSIHAAFISGVNFPEIIVRDNLNQAKPLPIVIEGKKLRYLSLDIMWFIFCRNRFSTQPSWFKFVEKGMSFQDGSFRDPLPFFAGIVMGLAKYTNPNYRKRKLNL